MHTMNRRAAASAVAALSLPCAWSQEAAQYPDKPLRIVVPYPPGGFNDTLGRLLATHLANAWKQPAMVDNRPGGGTTIGTQAVATARADGLTLLVAQFPFGANPWLYKLPYDTVRAFAPVMLAGRAPMVLVAHAAAPYRNAADLVKAARERPGAIPYGSSGPGSSNHLFMVLFESLSGIRMNQVPYKGSTPMLTDLAGGQIDVAVDLLPQALPFIQSGKVRPLAIASDKRSPLMPDIPTAAEAGVPGFEGSSWHGIVAPAGTPEPVIAKLNAELNRFLQLPEARKTFAAQGVVPDGGTPADFQRFIESQLALWKRVVQQNHITAG
ncbi:tripartite tricarboxylate transporter substrate binding protein [Paracidovorax anthurii]|uniref:Tripartite-type tricarboxylate transporter receptor subunit TctC n=1 Tax=Paracidovorax anthurii TaxID=78229 RepID=A0A328ZH00_9BURK|nr:tripartite tricarboxylate transporter substrate binding protein [Paracidovorax anthurii]RAR85139.1 tripartite-type tricarboxylate transporter receptor subunit TctC [Paracidovorax anthurii]